MPAGWSPGVAEAGTRSVNGTATDTPLSTVTVGLATATHSPESVDGLPAGSTSIAPFDVVKASAA